MSQAGQELITVSAPASLTACDVLLQRFGKEIPLACHQHGRAAAAFLLAQVGEIHPGGIQQPDAGHADVVLHVAGRAAGKVNVLGLVLWPVLGFQILGEPVSPVLTVACPDIPFLVRARRP